MQSIMGVKYRENSNAPWKEFAILRGEKGERGFSGVYVGSGDMPNGYNVQIDPNGSATSIIDLLIENLPVYEGEVESV